jgi:hypothetical protein
MANAAVLKTAGLHGPSGFESLALRRTFAIGAAAGGTRWLRRRSREGEQRGARSAAQRGPCGAILGAASANEYPAAGQVTDGLVGA